MIPLPFAAMHGFLRVDELLANLPSYLGTQDADDGPIRALVNPFALMRR
jgi:hypothetical protein